jgi:hypothetical protein
MVGSRQHCAWRYARADDDDAEVRGCPVGDRKRDVLCGNY